MSLRIAPYDLPTASIRAALCFEPLPTLGNHDRAVAGRANETSGNGRRNVRPWTTFLAPGMALLFGLCHAAGRPWGRHRSGPAGIPAAQLDTMNT